MFKKVLNGKYKFLINVHSVPDFVTNILKIKKVNLSILKIFMLKIFKTKIS